MRSSSSREVDIASQFDTNPHSLRWTQELRTQEFSSDQQSWRHHSDGATKNRIQFVLYGKQKELQKH